MNNQGNFVDKVEVREDTITLPTYGIEGENCNPVFRSQYGVAHIYPYTLLDDIAATPIDKTYRTLILENCYLKIIVIPDLGGRVYSVFDKILQKEVFYKNSIVKFSPLAIRGAFFSGGVEFSFPVAHAPTTADPVNWNFRENEDGSASISIGGLEHISRLRWMITLTLFPDLCALAQDVYLHNPYSIPGRYHYWTNASLDADDQTEFIYPLRRVRSYEYAGTSSWPLARLDLIQKDPGLPGMEGVPMWPADRMHDPMNFRWQKNMLAQVSIFGRDVSWDFFGAWQHSSNSGYAHFADHKDVSGMKLWSWGNTPVGVVNQSALTDDGSEYAETQCGAMETQLDFAFLPPSGTRSWREWWLPLRGMGGLSCASAEAGALLNLSHSDKTGIILGKLAICPIRKMENANVMVAIGQRQIISQSIDLSPETPWSKEFEISARELADKKIHLVFTNQDNQVCLDYIFDREPSIISHEESSSNAGLQTSQDFLQLGLAHENFDNREQALSAYQSAIQISPNNGEAHLRLGLMLLRAADWFGAQAHFQSAINAGISEANYYLGLTALYLDQIDIAHKAFLAVPENDPLFHASKLSMGCISFRQKDYQQAHSQFVNEYQRNSQSLPTILLLAISLRLLDNLHEAQNLLHSILKIDPLNHSALYELSLLSSDNTVKQKVNRLLEDDRQYILDLAGFYWGIGLIDEALIILKEFSPTWDYPMKSYLAAFFCKQLDKDVEGREWLNKAMAENPEYGFPSRLEEVLALEHALSVNNQDRNARYYLGNFMYAHQRFDEGIGLWRESLASLDNFDVVHRNLGLAAWQREQQYDLAIQHFEKALKLNPNNQDIYLHLDDLYTIQGQTSKRKELLEKINALSHLREDLRKRRIQVMVDLGNFSEALMILTEENFVPLEMDQSFHNLYVRALLLQAEHHIKEEKLEEAVKDYLKALEYPPNLGVGRPTTNAQAHVLFKLGLVYESMGKFSDALGSWRKAAIEHHATGDELYQYVQYALDKLSRYSELGFDSF